MAEAAGLAKVLECTLCGSGFSSKDVEEGKFYASTGICRECYSQGQKASRKVWCFGKEDLRKGKRLLKAYNLTAPECTLHCPDRIICRQFINQAKEKEN